MFAEENYIPQENIAEGGGGVSEQAKEAMAEETRKAAAQQKRDRKDEATAKQKDNKLAELIMRMIQTKDDRLMLLIARLLEKNVPVTFILGILALNHPELHDTIDLHLSFETLSDEKLMLSDGKNLPAVFSDDTMQSLDEWANKLFQNASAHPIRHIHSLAHHGGVENSAIQLSAFMIEEFMEKKGFTKDFNEIQTLAEFILRQILHKLHDIADNQGLLEAPEIEEENDEIGA